MVVRVEEHVTAVASPALLGSAQQQQRRLCTAAFEGSRYVFFAVDALLVVLVEALAAPLHPRSDAKRSSQFELWQVWHAHEPIACARFNATTKRVARGALALCLGEGRVALLTPTGAARHLPTAAPPVAPLTRTASRLSIKTSETELKPVSSSSSLSAAARRSTLVGGPRAAGAIGDVTSEYLKVHLHLHLPTWQESIRWKADDRQLDRVEWVESGDDLWLVGAGEKITTWKLVEESGVVAYQQLSFAVGEPDQCAWHMDVTQTGRFVATAGRHDRVLKLWSLQELAHDGTPVCSFLAHRRALVSATWARHGHAFKIRGDMQQTGQCEMLYTLDRAGTISIWRENLASPNRAFTLWKTLTTQDLLVRSNFGDEDMAAADVSPLTSWGLVTNDWGREPPRAPTPFTEVLLEETNVMAALSQFHYGYTSLDEVRRNELLNQRMDNVPKANAKRLGGRTGMIADSHAGEAFIAGNMPLHKTFLVHLGVGVHDSGDLSLFRIESIPFSGVSPRTSLLCLFSGLREHLMGATVYTATSADYKDRENGSLSFFLEVLFQPRGRESHLKVARLKLQVEGGGTRSSRSSVAYSVQACEIGDVSQALMSANCAADSTSSLTLANINLSANHAVTFQHGSQVDMLKEGSYLGDLKVAHRAGELLPSVSAVAVRTAQWPKQNILFSFVDGRLHATSISHDSFTAAHVPVGTHAANVVGTKMLFSDDEVETDGMDQLITCAVSASQKKSWSSASASFFFAAAPSETPTVLKDFCVVIGLKLDRKSLIVWVVSMEPVVSGEDVEVAVDASPACPLQLFRRVAVEVPDNQRLLHIAPTPSLEEFETLFVSVAESTHILSLWSFADMDEMSTLLNVHSTDLTPMLRATPSADASSAPAQDMMRFSFLETKHVCRELIVSGCGRAAVLFEEATGDDTFGNGYPQAGGEYSICIASLFDTWHESVVKISRKKHGQLLAIRWTPPLAPSLNSQIVFLTATSIGVIRTDDSTSDGEWNVAWSSSRLTAKPRDLSDMTRYPQAYLSLGTGIAELNLADLAGSGLESTLAATDVASNVAHPITLLFLLMRGSFKSLDSAAKHVKESIIDHEKTCYMKMLEDQELNRLPFMKLEHLFGELDDKEERSVTFTKCKTVGANSGFVAPVQPRASLARASDLFAMDFGSVRRSSLAMGLGGSDSASTFGVSSTIATAADVPAEEILGLESAELSTFFREHKASLTFLAEDHRSVFLEILAGSKKIISWEKDPTRAKDVPALRFAASLLWPYKPKSVEEKVVRGAEGQPVVAEDQAEAPSVGGICSEQVAWAALSDCQAELLQECFSSPSFTIQDLKQLRLPFWLKSFSKLAQFTEKAAQAEYATTRDPFRVALLYVLLGKTKLLVSLFKMSSEPKIAELLANDFADPRWKNAAVKNAYVLKAKRRHELSATFFLLGGKVQEAMSVAEHADSTMVLSFLIARLSEKWDLGGSDAQNDNSSGGFGEMSFTGLSSNMRTLDAIRGGADGGGGSGSCKGVCKEYLTSAVYNKAMACGDVFMAFLVRYLTGETSSSIQMLLAVPSVDVTCLFDPKLNSASTSDPRRNLYWRVFGQSLQGAAELVWYLRPVVPRMTSAMKVQIVHLQTIALNRLFAMGCNVPALYQQRDCGPQFKQFCKEKPPQSAAVRAAFLAVRSRILASVVSGQSDLLSCETTKMLDRVLAVRSSTSSTALVNMFEDCVDCEIQCLARRGGRFDIDDLPETQDAATESMLKTAVLDTLRQAGRTAVEDFVFSHWSSSQPHGNRARESPLQQLLEAAVDGITTVASGDLVASATSSFHSKHVDQICAELLGIAEKLLGWLAYFFDRKRPESKSQSATGSPSAASAEFIRVVTASLYSVICLCCRYVKTPCCVHRAFSAIFPHIESLPQKALDHLKESALADVCVHCSAVKGVKQEPPATGVSSLQRDIPVLYQIVTMLRTNLNIVVDEVRTGRLALAPPMQFYSYCQYWTLVLCIGSSAMPAHVSKIAVDGADPHGAGTALAKKLAQTWSIYSLNLAKHSSRMLLCEFTASFFRPFSVKAPSTLTGSAPGTPKDAGGSGSPAASTVANPASSTPVLSPLGRDRRAPRQLLRCTCDRCPWLLIVKMFANKDELLLRINSQLECCSEKIKEEISWGHLPDFPSKKAALTRSQKILLSNAAAGKGPELSDLLEKRILQGTQSIQLEAHCIYRSDVSIKSLCFNRATEAAELVLCSSKGISRTASVEYSDGTKYQFKGMYAYPLESFADNGSVTTRRRTADASSMMRSATDNAQRGSGDSGAEMKMLSFKPTAVESHPFLPLFVSGTQKGKVLLWSYESLSAVCEFQTKDVVATYPLGQASSSRRDIKKLRFDNLGQQMGAIDSLGRLFMWKFANLDREPCYRQLDCHDKGAKSLQFINSSSIVATVGSSSDKRSVCMWDLLLPNSKALVAAPSCHPAGAASLTFSPTHQLLISGGEGGSISVFDVRQRRVLHTITNAHETAITTLELHPSGRCVLSGSASGDVKIWSLPIFRELVAVSKVHAKPSFLGDAASNILGDAASNMAINVTNSSWGVTDAFATDDYFFTSGTDGSVQRFRVPSLSMLL